MDITFEPEWSLPLTVGAPYIALCTVNRIKHNSLLALILALAGVALYIGWREFLFLTDDAFIAFRYVSNSIMGHGYVWNAAPFRAVEGYTSFLWILILEAVWRLTEIKPPQSANVLSLFLSYGTLLLTVLALYRMELNRRLEGSRILLIVLGLVFLLTNTTFLTWSSSGLETALFNFCFTAWMVAVIWSRSFGHRWRLTLTLLASAVYLSRPDGILAVLATFLLLVVYFVRDLRSKRFNSLWLLSCLPILIPPVHLLWRKSFYGEWLPNTYYAKHVAIWPESGIRYLASFMLEYGVWIWFVVLSIALYAGWRKSHMQERGLISLLTSPFTVSEETSMKRLRVTIAVVTLVLQVGYYTFAIGGDHFEWRVYSHLPPFVFISFVFLLNALDLKRPTVIVMTVLMIVFSLPIPWAHHFIENRTTKLEINEVLEATVADKLPFLMWPLAKPDDALQKWLNDHLVCIRRQEHKLFVEEQFRLYPERSSSLPKEVGRYPVAFFSTVGVAGWTLPRVNIIDGYGLNDYIIARNKISNTDQRRMAHDRSAPEDYFASFVPNITVVAGRRLMYYQRPAEYELTPNRIRAIEKYWEDKIVHGINIPDSLAPYPISEEPD